MTANDELLDIHLSHAVRRLKYSDSLARRMVKLLNAVEGDLVETIGKRMALIDERGYDTGPATTARLDRMFEEISALNDAVYSGINSHLLAELATLGTLEAGFAAEAIETVIGKVNYTAVIPSPARLEAIVTTRPMQGEHLTAWVNGMAQGTQRRVEQALRIGMTEGETIDQMVRRIRGTRAAKYTDGIMQTSRRSATAIVRTAVNHVANQSHQMVWQENADVISGYRWVSTLDFRTSSICQHRDGEVYEVGKGPVPPAHPQCRSTTVAVIKSAKDLPFEIADDATRASLDGQVPAKLTYGQWIMRQSPQQLRKKFGKKKSELLLDGKIKFEDLIRPDGSETTLAQLFAK